MLDVHLPHKKLHGLKEFLVHIFTITVGLLIATQIESCVEWRHHVHLAEEARAELRTEIEKNLQDMKQVQPALKQWRKQIDDNLKAMQRIQDHPKDPKAQEAKLSVNFSTMSFSDTAWRTAQATGALGYMPYDEAERYSEIYQCESSLVTLEEKPMQNTAEVLGLIDKFGFRGTISKKITVEQADALAEKFGQMRLHLLAGDLVFQECIEHSQAFLENRKSKENFSGSLDEHSK